MASRFYERYIPAFDPTIKENSIKKPKVESPPEKPIEKPKVISPSVKDNPSKKPKVKSTLVKYEASKSLKRSVPQDDRQGSPEQGPLELEDDNGFTPLTLPAPTAEQFNVSIFSALPEWIRHPVIASSATQEPFEQFALSDKVVSNLSKEGLSEANGLQCRILPMLLPGPDRHCGDICISAATGSGKTLAYVLPLIESLRNKPMTRLRGLVVVPTRELVSQACSTFEKTASGTGIRIGVAVGNNRLRDEQKKVIQKSQRWSPEAIQTSQRWSSDAQLTEEDIESREDEFERRLGHVLEYASNIDVLICTPGRLVDHIKSTKGFHLHHVQWLVIDEADRLLDESFQEWIDNVIPQLEYVTPASLPMQRISQTFGLLQRRKVQKIILSATMTNDFGKLNSLRLSRPSMVVLEDQGVQEEKIKLPKSLMEFAMAVAEVDQKPLYVVQLLHDFAKLESKRNENDVEMEESHSDSSVCSLHVSRQHIPGTLVFAKSNESALRLARLLSMLLPDHRIRALTKSPGDKKGRKTLSMFRRGKVSVVVATDLASRGLDILDLAFVINYEMPASLISYVHRVGRTARAGREGRAVTLVEHKEGKWFWNDIARTKDLERACKVTRMDAGLRAGPEERLKYEDALRDLALEATGGVNAKTR